MMGVPKYRLPELIHLQRLSRGFGSAMLVTYMKAQGKLKSRKGRGSRVTYVYATFLKNIDFTKPHTAKKMMSPRFKLRVPNVKHPCIFVLFLA